MAGARVTNASLHKQLAESSSVAAENAAANDKARRDFQNHKRALAGELSLFAVDMCATGIFF